MSLCSTTQAVSHGQSLLIPTTGNDDAAILSGAPPPLTADESDVETTGFVTGTALSQVRDLLQSLPRNLHWDQAAPDSETSRPLEILEEEGEESEEGLEIAWQYRKSIQKERLGHGGSKHSTAVDKTYCHSYDLSGRMSDQRTVEDHVTIVDGSCCDTPCQQTRVCGFRLYQHWLTQLKQKWKEPKQGVLRLLLYRAPIQSTSVALPLLLAYIRTHQLPVVILVTTQSWTFQAGLIALRRASDAVLQTEGFASRVRYPPPLEFRHLHGLLLLPKVSTVTAAAANCGGHFANVTVSKRPPAHVYGLKRDRRKLHVPLLHIPPEDYAGGGGSAGGARSGAGRHDHQDTSCGSGASSLLDF